MADNNNNLQNGLDGLEERINANFGTDVNAADDANSQRLKEVNKKLPDWNLEPPMNFIK